MYIIPQEENCAHADQRGRNYSQLSSIHVFFIVWNEALMSKCAATTEYSQFINMQSCEHDTAA